MWAGREETSALFGFLAGLHPVVTELVLLCNGAFPGRGFPPLLLLGPQFLQLSSHSIYIYAPSKGNHSPGFLKVRTYFRFIATKHYFIPSMIPCFSVAQRKTCFIFYIIPYALFPCPQLF